MSKYVGNPNYSRETQYRKVGAWERARSLPQGAVEQMRKKIDQSGAK